MELLLFLVISGVIIFALTKFVNAVSNARYEKKVARQKANGTYQEKKPLLPRPDSRDKYAALVADYWGQYNKQRAEIAKELQSINFSFMLGLPDLTEEKYTAITADAIVHAHNPFEAFKSHIKPGKPTIAEFCLCMETMFNQLTEEMQFSESDKNNIYAGLLPMLVYGTTDELIEQILQSYAASLPSNMNFLKTKVNYELVMLGHIMQYGLEQQRSDICEKVNEHRSKKGYI